MKRPSDMTLGAILLVLGAFAGFCLGRFTSNLTPEKLVMQWDIGNTFVGVATTVVALTSIWIALTNNRRESSQKLADYRTNWSEMLRADIAKFLSLLHVKPDHADLDKKIVLELAEVKHRILIRIQKEKHSGLVDALKLALEKARIGSDDELTLAIEAVHYEAEKILEEAWTRASAPLTQQTT